MKLRLPAKPDSNVQIGTRVLELAVITFAVLLCALGGYALYKMLGKSHSGSSWERLELVYVPVAESSSFVDPDHMLRALAERSNGDTMKELVLSGQGAVSMSAKIPRCGSAFCTVEIRFLTSKKEIFWARRNSEHSKFSQLDSSKINVRNSSVNLILQDKDLPTEILGYSATNTILPITAYVSPYNAIEFWASSFERNGGLVTGSLLTLALFSLVLAIFHRDLPFLVLAGWLVGALRLAAFNHGWGPEWFGIYISSDTQEIARRLTLCMQGVLASSLYFFTFKDKLEKYERNILKKLGLAFLCITPLSFLLTKTSFSLAFWALTLIALSSTLWVAVSQLARKFKALVLMFAMSWLVFYAGAIADIAYISGSISEANSLVNLKTAAVFAGFILAITLANRMQEERSARVQAEADKQLAQEDYQHLFKNAPVGLVRLEKNGQILDSNPAAMELLGLPSHKGAFTLQDFLPRTTLQLLIKANGNITEVRLGDGPGEGDDARWVAVRCTEKDGVLEASVSDITTRKHAEFKLRALAEKDPLTGVWNRQCIIDAIDGQISSSSEIAGEFSAQNSRAQLLMFDIDRFHQAVTFFGHRVGDLILVELKNRIMRATNDQLMLGRLSSDTFVAIVPSDAYLQGQELLDKALSCINDTPFIIEGSEVYISASASLLSMEGFENARLVVAAGDMALKTAKNSGGRQSRVMDITAPDWQNTSKKLDMMKEFTVSIPFELMEMHLQPVVALNDSLASVSYEALLRMRQPDGRMVNPGIFIPALEEAGLMAKVDNWVVRTVFDYLNAQPAHLDKLRYCAINLSGATLNDPNASKALVNRVKANKHIANKVCFEITESIAVMDFDLAKRLIDELKSHGCHVALDDFGAGYSSFSYLAAMKADVLKIDGSLVKNMKTTPEGESVIRSITELAHSFDMKVVAEWVETAEIAADLKRLGVDYGQGWALCRPQLMNIAKDWRNASDFVSNDAVRQVLALDSRDSRPSNGQPATPQTAAPSTVSST